MSFQSKTGNIKGIGLGIVAFEGTEHLASIITEFRDIVDYVVIGLQRKSYHGDPIEPIDLNEIFRLKDEDHLVDNVLEVVLDSSKEPRIQETDKRNMLIQDIEDHGCSHAIIIDSDEYYSHNSILKAVQEIDEHDYEITYCQYINYYADYNHFLVYPFKDGMYVPFITKTKYRHSFDCTDFPMPSDPTRRFVRPYDREDDITFPNGQKRKQKHFTVDYYIFPWNVVKMHHLSWLRADMRKKVNNWSSKTCFENYNDLIDKAIDAYDHFDHDSKDEQKASLLFNTPNHEVLVHAFPRQYIHPKYDYLTRLRPARSEKKIAIMNLSTTNSEIGLFERLEEYGRLTWAKDVLDGKYSNIDYWCVIDCHEDSHIDEEKHMIYVKNDYSKENIQQLLDRWVEACELLAKYKSYDYILRTNTSTWVNIEFINEMLAYQTDDSKIFTHKFYSAFWSTFNVYCSGAAMVWPVRNIPILRDLIKHTSEKVLNLALDDVMMSALWRQRAEKLELTDPNDCWTSLEGYCLADKYSDIDWDNVNIQVPMIQIKTFANTEEEKNDDTYRLASDTQKMVELDAKYRQWRNSISDSAFKTFVETYMKVNTNKTIGINRYSKQEWQKGNLTFEQKTKETLYNWKPYNQETIDWLENRAKECGYKHPYYWKNKEKK